MNNGARKPRDAGLSCAFGLRRLLICFVFLFSVAGLTAGSGGAARADDFGFVGGTAVVPSYGAHPAPECVCGAGPGDAYTYDQSGSFTTASNWDASGQAFSPAQGTFATTAPGAGDNVSIGGVPAGYLPPVEGPAMTLCEDTTSCLVTVPVYGYYGGPGGPAGYTGGNGFQVSGAAGTIANLNVGGPGTLGLGALTVTGSTTIASIGGVALLAWVPGVTTGFGEVSVTGYAPSALTINGGSLSTPMLTLVAGTIMAADPGSLTIKATLSGDITRVYGIQPGSSATQAYVAQPVTLSSGTLNAKTELDIVGIDPTQYPLATGTATLTTTGSTITAGNVVIGTGATGLGSGSSTALPATLTLDGSSKMTVTQLVVGDTGTGNLNAMGGSTITSQTTLIGSSKGSTGVATVSGAGSTWNNSSFIFVGLAGTGTLNVKDNATVTSSDIIDVGLNAGSTGTIAISGGGTLTTNTLSGTGTSSVVIGFAANTNGYLTIDGAGSELIANGAMSIGYDGYGNGNITKGGTLTINSDTLRVGRNADGSGVLIVNGSGSNVTGTDATMYVGYGGQGTVEVQNKASLSLSAINIGGMNTGHGELDVDGDGTAVDVDTIVTGDSGTGQFNITNKAAVTTTGDVTVGKEEGSSGTIELVTGAGQLTVGGDLIVGDKGTGTVSLDNGSTVTADSVTVGNGETGVGTLNLNGGGNIATTGDLTLGQEAGAQGTVNIGQTTAATMNIDGEFKVGDEGTGMAKLDNGSTVMADTLTVGGGATGIGVLTLDHGSSITTSGDGTVGDEAGAQGTVTIGLNAASQLTIGGDLTVGGEGMGTLLANTGSTLTVQGKITVGDESTGNGLITLNGAKLSSGGDLTIGAEGTGELLMQEGAKNDLGGTSFNTPSVTIGEQSGSHGKLLMDGNGTSFQVSDLTVGKLGQGTLMLSNKAVLTSNGDVSVADQISGVISDVNVATSSMLAINGNLTVGGGGIATMEVVTGGKATTIGEVSLGDNPNGVGIVTIDGVQPTAGAMPGARSSLGYGQTLTVGNFGQGTLNITGGALVAPTPGGQGDVEIAAQSHSTGAVTVSGSDPKSGAVSNFAANTIAVGGTMKSAGGTGSLTVSDGGTVQVAQILEIWGDGTVDVSGGGSVTVGSGAAAAAGTVRVDEKGTLGGAGTIIGDLVNAGGTVSPGDPVTLNVIGDYIQTDGVLDLQIAGTGDSDYDHIVATGGISITGGTINLDFIDGFAPTEGETFDFLSALNGVSLVGVAFDVTGLQPGFDYVTFIDPTSGDLELNALNTTISTSVPEPDTDSLLASGFVILAIVASRRRRLTSLEGRQRGLA